MSSNGTSGARPSPASERIDWVDYAKGICIVMVVMMHSTLGVEAAAGKQGFMHLFVEFAKPFRMPDFFLISGLFLARVIGRDWRTYLDRKVVHFAYFYVLWVTIQFAFKAPAFAAEQGWTHVGVMYLQSFIEPFGTLWFIYLLPIFFVVTKATLRVPAIVIWLAAAALETAHIATGWTVIDEFAARFVYFYSGYLLANYVFALADRAREKPGLALAGLAAWALVNGVLVFTGFGDRPVISLALGFAGACAIIVTGTLLARANWLGFLRPSGAGVSPASLPSGVGVSPALRIIPDIGLVSLIDTIAGVVGALLMWWGAKRAGLNFLFERPAMFWIAPKQKRPAALQAAE